MVKDKPVAASLIFFILTFHVWFPFFKKIQILKMENILSLVVIVDNLKIHVYIMLLFFMFFLP